MQRKALTPNDSPLLGGDRSIAQRQANFERQLESIAHPFQWKFSRINLNALIARIRDRWAQGEPSKLAA